MAILITGGTGGTGTALAHLLQKASMPFIMTSRRGQAGAPEGMPCAKFDWLDESTWANAFEQQKDISAIYLVAPHTSDPDTPLIKFVEWVRAKYTVKRFVLCAGGSVQVGSGYLGNALKFLVELTVEFSLLRPTWFMENFSGSDWGYRETIKNENKIYTAAENGQAFWVSNKDIANVAFHALTMKDKPKGDYHVLGPELLTYDDIASKFSSALGRKIEHVKVSPEERKQKMISIGHPEHFGDFIVFLDTFTKDQKEVREGKPRDDVEKLTGKKPITFDEWLKENKAVWQ